MNTRVILDYRSRLAAILAAAGLAAAAHADVFSFEGYAVGPLAGQSDPTTTRSWEVESTSADQPPEIVTGINSPRTAGNTAVRYQLSGAGLSSTQVGVDLSTEYGTGIVKVSYDFFRGDLMTPDNRPFGGGAPGRNELNIQLFNKPIVGPSAANTGTAGTADKLLIQYHRHVWTEKLAAPKVFASNNGAAFGFVDNFHQLNSEVFGSFSEAASTWMHMEMYFDYSNPAGELIYSAIYHINADGSLRKLSERRPAVQGNVITMNPTAVADPAGAGIAAIQLGMNIGQAFSTPGPSDINQTWYVDNLAVETAPGFTLPPAMDQLPAPTARPPQQSTRVQEAVVEIDLIGSGAAPVGENPSLALIGNTLYSYDTTNFIRSWDVTTGSMVGVQMFPSNINNNVNVGVMTRSADGTKLYFTSTSPFGEWGALYSFDIASMTDGGVPAYDAYQRNFGDGQHSPVVISMPGETDRVLGTWRGAQFYDAYPADGVSAAGGLGGVGNRWDGGAAEAYAWDAPLSERNKAYVLLRTDANGLRSPTQAQASFNAIYLATFGPGGSVGTFAPLSPSRQVLPWEAPCADGACLGTHRMQYVAQTNSIWVVRGSGTNDIGIYDIDTDDWRIVQVQFPGGSAMAFDRTDIELVGDRMYIYNRGESAVYSIDVINLGALPTGACCAADGSCSIATQPDCDAAGGTYNGDNSTCEDIGAPTVTSGPGLEDISGTGTSLRSAAGMQDDTSHLRSLGFTFNYYGTAYTEVWVNSNGFIAFEQPESDFAPGSLVFPSGGGTNSLIAPFAFDWNPDASISNDGVTKPGDVFEEVRGAVGARRYILQWNAVSHFDSTGYIAPHTFQVILYEATGNIEFRYGSLQSFAAGTLGGTPEIGQENQDGSRGHEVSATPATITNGTQVFFSADPCPALAICVCETDGNDAQVNVFDLLAYLNNWFPQNAAADIDGTPGVNVFDLLFFLDCWFPASAGSPCP